ncbi:hypothetical protein HYX16_04230 [Candidatus Woesearchaeota archaeon]|nr:hypothetical protein [Candidatus Woesearchaeota archaeon]
MTELVACLSTGKGTWGHVNRLLEDESWEKVILITNEYGKENFKKNEKSEFLVINPNQGLRELRDEIHNKLKDQIKGTEVAINFISGSGKEHMALIGALLKLGVGIRLTALTKEGIEEI